MQVIKASFEKTGSEQCCNQVMVIRRTKIKSTEVPRCPVYSINSWSAITNNGLMLTATWHWRKHKRLQQCLQIRTAGCTMKFWSSWFHVGNLALKTWKLQLILWIFCFVHTVYDRIFLDARKLVKKFLAFMELEMVPIPSQINLIKTLQFHFPDINLNAILPAMPRSSKMSLSFMAGHISPCRRGPKSLD